MHFAQCLATLSVDSVGSLERDEQSFFFVQRRAAQRLLVTADERHRPCAASSLGCPLCADLGMLSKDHERATPPARLSAAQPGEQPWSKPLAQHDDGAMPGRNPGGGLAHVMQQCGCDQVRFGVALPAQHAHYIEAVALIGNTHPAKEFLRVGGQDLVSLTQIVR